MHLEFRQSQTQNQVQTLKQWLSPKMIQVLTTFHLPYTQLVQQVESAVQDNIFLEVTRYDQLAAPIAERRLSSRSDYSGADEPDAYNSVIEQKPLHQHLLDQLRLESLPHTEMRIAEALIDQINDKGYLIDYDPVRRHLASRFDVAERKIGDVLKIIQEFDPDGVGARTLKECLLIQLRQLSLESEELHDLLHNIISHHLESLSEGNFRAISDELDIDSAGVEEIAEFIRTQFNPHPGLQFSAASPAAPIIPSFEFRIIDGKVKIINLEATSGIQVGISAEYIKELKNSGQDGETQRFLQERYEKAKLWVELIKKRQDNLNEIAKVIAERQQDFLLKGLDYLKPLMQKEIATTRSISPSTVSRIVSSKYVQTPQGLLAFKALCPRAYFGRSQAAMIAEIKDAIAEFPDYSDQKIARYLAQKGLKVARRTVNKYRHYSY